MKNKEGTEGECKRWVKPHLNRYVCLFPAREVNFSSNLLDCLPVNWKSIYSVTYCANLDHLPRNKCFDFDNFI